MGLLKELNFVKLSNRWFVDILWDGDISDLQMVSGADTLLDVISDGKQIVKTLVGIEDFEPNGKQKFHLKKIEEDGFDTGCYYRVNQYEYKGELWLCNVTKHIFGEFPENMYIWICGE